MVQGSQHLLVVHAHPDDEVLGTGGVIAKHTAGGGEVTLVTCTLGEEGEILTPDVAHLAADQQDDLGSHRLTELAGSVAALGIQHSRILGGAGKYRDSGMMGEASNNNPAAFWRADLREAATLLAEIIRETKPEVLVTYDDFGGYGHPDHIQAHRIAMYGAQLAAVGSYRSDLGLAWDVRKIYWICFPVSAVRSGILALRERGDKSAFASRDPDDLPFATPDEAVTTAVDVEEQLPQKVAAFKAHASQVNLEEGLFALSNNVGSPIFSEEYFRLVKGTPGLKQDVQGRETGLLEA
jgi:N-acetyl-1-D-myo-inositol-2-amino-2-deoxy-alpha-D-glucopyranoside deacetylase